MRNVLIPRKTYRLAMRIIMILTVTLLIFTIRNLFVASVGIHHINSSIETCKDSLNSYYAQQGIYLAEDLNY